MKVSITYVVKEIVSPVSYIESLCNRNGFNFETRKYSSKLFSDDRHCIRSLPAYHIYINNNYYDTIYPSFDILEKIESVIAEADRMNKSKRCFRQKPNQILS
jgi:hypothetical protein